jgi:hypothetical protein
VHASVGSSVRMAQIGVARTPETGCPKPSRHPQQIPMLDLYLKFLVRRPYRLYLYDAVAHK